MRLTYVAPFALQVFEMRPDRKKRRIYALKCITTLSKLITANCMAVMTGKPDATTADKNSGGKIRIASKKTGRMGLSASRTSS